jgi:hypothetical protein
MKKKRRERERERENHASMEIDLNGLQGHGGPTSRAPTTMVRHDLIMTMAAHDPATTVAR